jgi:hypothetical protein
MPLKMQLLSEMACKSAFPAHLADTNPITASILQRLPELRPGTVVAKTDFRSFPPMVEALRMLQSLRL